jgi:hypothetical protein
MESEMNQHENNGERFGQCPGDEFHWPDWLCLVGIFALSVFFGWLLSLAYPEGLINEETHSYWVIEKGFRWFSPNTFDWVRTIPYGGLLFFFSQFENPTRALYWLNELVLSLCFALVFVLARSLPTSRSSALALAVSVIIFEVASMRIFFLELQICPDPLFAELVFLGCLLALVGWLRKQRLVFLSGYAIFGVAAFMKPAGAALIPVWIPFAVWSWWPCSGYARLQWVTILLSIALLVGPLGFWAVRNYHIYGYAKSVGNGGFCLLQAVLPLMTDHDQMFAEPKVNADFIAAVRTSERIWQMHHDPHASALVRRDEYERYFLACAAPNGPFQFLAPRTNPVWRNEMDHGLESYDPAHMFKMGAESERIAFCIIRSHPIGYLRRIIREYVDLFSPLALPYEPYDNYQEDQAVAYRFWNTKHGPRPLDLALYPGRGIPNASQGDREVAKALGVIYYNPLFRWCFDRYYTIQFLLSHLIFLAAIGCFTYATVDPSRFRNPAIVLRISMVLMMLFLTTAANYAVPALCHIAKIRYALAGDMTLHLMLLIVFLVLASGFASLTITLRARLATFLERRASV